MSDTTTTKPTEGIEGYLSWATHLQNGVREYIAKEGNIILRGWQHSVQGFLASDVGKALSMAAIAYAESHGVPEERIDNIEHVIHNAITLAIAEMPAEEQALRGAEVPAYPLHTFGITPAEMEVLYPPPPPPSFPTEAENNGDRPDNPPDNPPDPVASPVVPDPDLPPSASPDAPPTDPSNAA